MFSIAVEAAVEVADPLLQVVSVLRHHPITHHPFLSSEALELIATETSQPDGSNDQVLGVSLKVT